MNDPELNESELKEPEFDADIAPEEALIVELDGFEGPLDLLLHLIKKSEINIYDIPINLIAQQYLEYVEAMKELNLNVAGEFLVMAATLLQIKSKMLLPADEAAADGELHLGRLEPRRESVELLVVGGIGVAGAERAAVAHLAVADMAGELRERGNRVLHFGRGGHIGMMRGRADGDIARIDLDARQAVDAAQIDEGAWLRQAQLHRAEQALAARERLAAAGLDRLDRSGDVLRTLVFERVHGGLLNVGPTGSLPRRARAWRACRGPSRRAARAHRARH